LKLFLFLILHLEGVNGTNNILIPILNGIYDGETFTPFYIDCTGVSGVGNNITKKELKKRSDIMLLDSLKSLLIPMYNDYHIYLHNFSYFDGIFLLRIICKLSNNIKFIIRDNRLIQITVYFEIDGDENKYQIHFNDSLLLLPGSLDKLAKQFKVGNKLSFDLTENNLNMNTINNKQIKNELMEYNKNDCIILYNILDKFAEEIFDLFSLNISKYPTIASLSFAIFRSNFMECKNIPITDRNTYDILKPCYQGGHVDVYKPYGENIYRYDVNSLYPSIMESCDMPVRAPTYFEGNVNISNLFGFLYVEVNAPDIFVPVLGLRKYGKSIYPSGKWSGWYFSEEIKYAMTLGYTFKISKGFLFNKANVFSPFVNTLYSERLKYDKSDPKNMIYKFILNSLYGKFGMSPYIENYSLYDIKDSDTKYIKAVDVIPLDNKELISQIEVRNNEGNNLNISLPIAAAITVYARIHINKIKNQFKDNLFLILIKMNIIKVSVMIWNLTPK
jgi:hypothetical protein